MPGERLCHSMKGNTLNTQIVPIERAEDGALIVSSLTIAEGAEVTHQAVLKLIDQHVDRLGQVGFEIRGGYNNSKVRVALLNEKQATVLMMLMKNTEKVLDFKFALNDAFFQMAEQLQAPVKALSPDEIVAQALQITSARVRELESKVEQDAPKVGYVDSFVADNDALLFRTVASNLFIGETDLRWGLVYAGWIYHDQQRRRNSKNEYVTEHLWSEFSHKKPYFFRTMNHHAPLFKGNAMYSLKITPAGAAAIAAWVSKVIAEHGTFKAAVIALEARYNERKAS